MDQNQDTSRTDKPKRKLNLQILFLYALLVLALTSFFELALVRHLGPPREQKLGILALGGFVGWLLGFGLLKSKATLKAVLTTLGAALGGAPVVFMQGVIDKWMYPVGLIVGLLWIRVPNARREIIESRGRGRKAKHVRFFAWLDVIVILAVTLACTIYVFLWGE